MTIPGQWTVGQLRRALEGVPDDLPCVVYFDSGHPSNLVHARRVGAFPSAARSEQRVDHFALENDS